MEKVISKLSDKEALKYLVENGSCLSTNPIVVKDFDTNLQNIINDESKLDALLDTPEALNLSIHQNISCVISAIIEGSKSLVLTKQQKMHAAFKQPTLVGDPSGFGYAMKTSFEEGGNLFVVKTSRRAVDQDIREAVVGMFVTNLLREYVPNFMFVYGYTQCTRAEITEDLKVKEWCGPGKGESSYLITENIRNSRTLNEWVLDSNVGRSDLVIVLYQIFNALLLAEKLYGYVHKDLHTVNVLVRDFGQLLAIPIYDDEMKVKGHVVTRYVPYIIDYGLNTFTIAGRTFKNVVKSMLGTSDVSVLLIDLREELDFSEKQSQNKKDKLEVVDSLYGIITKMIYNKRLQGTISWFLWIHQRLFDEFLSSNEDIEKLTNVTFPMKLKLYNSWEFYQLISSQTKFQSTIQYLNKYQAVFEDRTLVRREKILSEILSTDLTELLEKEITQLENFKKEFEEKVKSHKFSTDDLKSILRKALSLSGTINQSIRIQVIAAEDNKYSNQIKKVSELRETFREYLYLFK